MSFYWFHFNAFLSPLNRSVRTVQASTWGSRIRDLHSEGGQWKVPSQTIEGCLHRKMPTLRNRQRLSNRNIIPQKSSEASKDRHLVVMKHAYAHTTRRTCIKPGFRSSMYGTGGSYCNKNWKSRYARNIGVSPDKPREEAPTHDLFHHDQFEIPLQFRF